MSNKKHKKPNKTVKTNRTPKQAETSYVGSTFSLLSSTFFKIASVVGLLFSLLLVVAAILQWRTFAWNDFWQVAANIIVLAFVAVLVAIIVLFSILLWKSASEIEQEKDKQFVVSVFSGITSMAAVIVALIALIRGLS